MAAALRAAEGGGIFFPNPQGGGYFQNFSGQEGIPPYLPLFPTPDYNNDGVRGTIKLYTSLSRKNI